MPRYVFDSSALLKRYHVEAGSDVVDAIFAEPGSRFLASRLAIVECVSALCLKVRSGEIAARDVVVLRKSLWEDVRRQRLSLSGLFRRQLKLAESLLLSHAPTHRLRAFDAVHLALALDLFRQRKVDIFVSADNVQCEVAKLEGLPTINPVAAIP